VALGARVWVTSGSDEKIERARELGAEGGFRYDDPDWPEPTRHVQRSGVPRADHRVSVGARSDS